MFLSRQLANLAFNKSGNECVSQVEVMCDWTVCFGGVKFSSDVEWYCITAKLESTMVIK